MPTDCLHPKHSVDIPILEYHITEMSKQALTTKEFLEQNPYCCFCGGQVPATTRDHIPPKIVFENKVWPDGFEFPACAGCNSATRLFDQEFGLLSCFGGLESGPTQDELAQFQKVLRGVANNNLQLAVALRMRSNQKRREFKEKGHKIEPGITYGEIPIIQMPPRADLAGEVIAFKLGCALHYKHFNRILPITGKVVSAIRTNYRVITEGIPTNFISTTTLAYIPKRGGKDLSKQFAYRLALDRKAHAGFFMCKFRDSLQIEAITIEKPSAYSFNFSEIPTVREFLGGLALRAKALEYLSTHGIINAKFWPNT